MIIAPSLLAADFTCLGKDVLRIDRAGADWLHLDIMDGHFVPNISFGPAVVKALRPLTKMVFDAHLMCERPEILLQPFVDAGVDRITIHVELGEKKVTDLIWKIRDLGKKVGLSIKPETLMDTLLPHLKNIDSILIMTVNPGFGGQPFITETLSKIQQAGVWRKEKQLKFDIAVDGGINFETAGDCARAGANAFISGTALLGEKNLSAAIKKMRALTEETVVAPKREFGQTLLF